jgi:hypothetical protein
MPIHVPEDVVADEACTAGTTQLPLTDVNVCPASTYPAQLLVVR